MKSKNYILAVVASGMSFFTYAIYGQNNGGDVYWHLDPSVKTCSMVIDPSLTQDQWKRYTMQLGEISSFKSMASAETIGKKHFSIALEYSVTPIDQHDPAWIKESLLATQGFIGVAYSLWRINLAAEYNISNVNTFSFLIGFSPFKYK